LLNQAKDLFIWNTKAIMTGSKITQVYNRYPSEKPRIERVFVRTGLRLVQMRHRSNYDWMLFLTSPMAFVGV